MEPSFTVQRRQFTDKSHFFVFAQNPVGLSPGVQISTSLIVGMKQGKYCISRVYHIAKSLIMIHWLTPLIPSFWTQSSLSENNLKNFYRQGPPLRHLGYLYNRVSQKNQKLKIQNLSPWNVELGQMVSKKSKTWNSMYTKSCPQLTSLCMKRFC